MLSWGHNTELLCGAQSHHLWSQWTGGLFDQLEPLAICEFSVCSEQQQVRHWEGEEYKPSTGSPGGSGWGYQGESQDLHRWQQAGSRDFLSHQCTPVPRWHQGLAMLSNLLSASPVGSALGTRILVGMCSDLRPRLASPAPVPTLRPAPLWASQEQVHTGCDLHTPFFSSVPTM